VISGFRREVDENCALTGYGQRGVVIYYRIQDSWPLTMGPLGYTEASVRNYHYSLCNNPEERSSEVLHLLRSIITSVLGL